MIEDKEQVIEEQTEPVVEDAPQEPKVEEAPQAEEPQPVEAGAEEPVAEDAPDAPSVEESAPAEEPEKEAPAEKAEPEPASEEPAPAPEPVEEVHPMRRIEIDKVVVNIGVGEAGEKLLRAKTLLEKLTGRTPLETISKTTNRDLAIRKGMPIGCKVTLRGSDGEDIVKKALWVKDNKLPGYCFDPEGNCSFGIPDYTEFEGEKYDPEIGIFGMDLCIVLKRPGFRIKHRRHAGRKVPYRHRITLEEGKAFVKERFSVEILEVA